MNNREIQTVLKTRSQLEARIKALGGTIPQSRPYADHVARNLQLLETVEALERKAAPKSFKAFVATKKVVADISTLDGWEDYEGAALQYFGGLVIENPAPNKYSLILENDIFDGDLPGLERRLYGYAMEAGII